MGMLDGKVAIVTGAGGGLGRVEALELARLGARVVVNDLGTTLDGQGCDAKPAEDVVAEIRAAGGQAVAQCGDVASFDDARALIQRAIDEFGSLEILVNNAGFTRDRMLFKMSEEDFDAVVRVHLKGHFCTMRHAMAYWRDRSKAAGGPVYGRMISTASDSFLFGAAGQPNYAAAKAGIVMLTMEAAQEAIRWGVTANVICPRARTRMTEASPWAAMFAKPEQGFDAYAPENIAPVVGWLASPLAANVSGQVLMQIGKSVTVLGRPDVSSHRFESDEAPSVESLNQLLAPFFEKREPVKDGYAVPPF
ncbi:MAG: SDR family NAD(P)-dependent oxidoreductase [Myxococcota bacterium]